MRICPLDLEFKKTPKNLVLPFRIEQEVLVCVTSQRFCVVVNWTSCFPAWAGTFHAKFLKTFSVPYLSQCIEHLSLHRVEMRQEVNPFVMQILWLQSVSHPSSPKWTTPTCPRGLVFQTVSLPLSLSISLLSLSLSISLLSLTHSISCLCLSSLTLTLLCLSLSLALSLVSFVQSLHLSLVSPSLSR